MFVCRIEPLWDDTFEKYIFWCSSDGMEAWLCFDWLLCTVAHRVLAREPINAIILLPSIWLILLCQWNHCRVNVKRSIRRNMVNEWSARMLRGGVIVRSKVRAKNSMQNIAALSASKEKKYGPWSMAQKHDYKAIA